MSPASATSSMSFGELAICQDFLNGHREYAIDLSSSIEKLCQWHATDSCLETRQGRACTLCAICSSSGLMGATKEALAIYDDAQECLKTVRASLGKNSQVGRAKPGQQTLFSNSLAKSLFASIVSAGEVLRSQHAAWRALLRTEAALSSTLPKGLFQHTNTGPSESDESKRWDLLLPTYSGPTVVDPEMTAKLTAASSGLASETTSSSSMFVVFRRCLSPDCPCDLNKTNVAAKTSKVIARSEAVTQERGHHATSRTSSDASGAPAKAEANPRPRDSTVHRDLSGPDAPSDSTPPTALWTCETELSSSECRTSIVDPRVFRLRAVIVQFDGVRGTLMAWCRACATDMSLDSREGPKASLTRETCGPDIAEPTKSLFATGHIGQGITKTFSHGDDGTTTPGLRFDEQGELKMRWLMARQKRYIHRQ